MENKTKGQKIEELMARAEKLKTNEAEMLAIEKEIEELENPKVEKITEQKKEHITDTIWFGPTIVLVISAIASFFLAIHFGYIEGTVETAVNFIGGTAILAVFIFMIGLAFS